VSIFSFYSIKQKYKSLRISIYFSVHFKFYKNKNLFNRNFFNFDDSQIFPWVT
jgi:hypothetical protein